MRHVNFKDATGMKCQVSLCSSSEPQLWLGALRRNDGLGLCRTRRMLLTPKQARDLGYLLLRFYNLGELSPDAGICAIGKKKPSPKG